MLIRVTLANLEDRNMAIVEAPSVSAALKQCRSTLKVESKTARWVKHSQHSNCWLLYDPAEHETQEEAEEDDLTIVLWGAKIKLGVFWDVDID